MGSTLAILTGAGISGWLKNNAFPLILLAVGIIALMGAGHGNYKDTLKIAGCVVIALAIIGVAVGTGTGINISNQLANIVSQ